LQPGHADAPNSYGIALQKAGRLDDAIECFARATSLQRQSVRAWCNYGGALQAGGRLDEALAACQEALRLDPGHALSANRLGTALQMRGRISEAMDAFSRAVELDPKLPEAWHNLGNSHRDQGEPGLALECYRKAVAIAPRAPGFHGTLAYALCFHPDSDAQAILAEHLRWDERHARPLKPRAGTHANEPAWDRPLHIGYVSPNFRDHVIGRNILPLLREHHRAEFEIYGYADVANPDSLTAQFRGLCSHWRDTRLVKDEQVAEMVRADRIDILVDLTLHLAGSQLLAFARNPGGTGMEAMGYRLTDPWLDPSGVSDGDYRETSIQLPHSFWCYDREAMMHGLEPEPTVGPLPALQRGSVTFGCLNVFSKVNPPLLRLWAKILREAKGSRLLLLASDGYPRSRALEILGAEGIDAARVRFAEPRPRAEYFRL
jgi:predicted O-linked N-acetylglucosamine transferase (SPINDLY family)